LQQVKGLRALQFFSKGAFDVFLFWPSFGEKCTIHCFELIIQSTSCVLEGQIYVHERYKESSV
jgi:hypothetical protein